MKAGVTVGTGIPPKPTRLPVALSAFVAPGAGQIAQKRWIAGLSYGAAFLAAFILFLVRMGSVIAAYYRLGMDPAHFQDTRRPVAAALGWLAIALFVYLAGILDTWVAYRRACSRWTEARLEAALLAIEQGDPGARRPPPPPPAS